jgi:hypothetical protein
MSANTTVHPQALPPALPALWVLLMLSASLVLFLWVQWPLLCDGAVVDECHTGALYSKSGDPWLIRRQELGWYFLLRTALGLRSFTAVCY